MNKNGSKTTKKSAAAEQRSAEPPENAQQVAAVETPETKPETGADVEGPADAPSDGKGCESVTVLIVANNEDYGVLMAHSANKNLIGVDADIHLVTGEHLRNTLIETLAEHMPHIKTERIILMTDGMVILNPITLGDIAVVKAKKVGETLCYNTDLPVQMHLSVLKSLLDKAKESGLDHIDVIDTYFRGTLPEDFKPVVLGEWHSDLWLLPVISKNPSIEALDKYAKWKKFAHVGTDSWSPNLVKYLEDRFGM